MSSVYPILSGVQIGCVLALSWVGWRTLYALRMSLRREFILARSLTTYDELLLRGLRGTLTTDELELGVALIQVGLEDEMHAQSHASRWRMAPPVGEPWPDDLLASLLDNDRGPSPP